MSGKFEKKGRVWLTAATLLLCVVAAPGRAAVSAIEEYYPGNDTVNPWGLKLVRDFDGTLTTYKYEWDGSNFKTTEDRGGGATPNSQTVVAGVETVTEVNSAGMVVNETKTDIASGQTISHMEETGYQATTPFPSAYKYTQPLATTESYSYDGQGNVLSHTDQAGVTTTYTYDALYRVTGGTRNGLTWTVNYSPGVVHTGDAATKVTMQDGSDTRTQTVETSPFGKTRIETTSGPVNETITTTDDGTSVTTVDQNATTGRNQTVVMNKGNRSETRTGNADYPWNVSYNFLGGGWKVTASHGSVTQATVYNGAGEVVEEDAPSPSGSGTVATRISYNANAWQQTVTDPTGQMTTYDLLPDGELSKVSCNGRYLAMARDTEGSSKIRWTWTNAMGETVWKRTYDPSNGTTVNYPWGDAAKAVTTTTTSPSSGLIATETKDGYGMIDSQQQWLNGKPTSGSIKGSGMQQSWTPTVNNFGQITQLATTLGSSAGPTTSLSMLGLPTQITGVAGMGTTSFPGTPFNTSTGNLDLSATQAGHTQSMVTSPTGWQVNAGGYGTPPLALNAPSFGGTGITRSFQVSGLGDTQETLNLNPGGTVRTRGLPGGLTESFGFDDNGAVRSWTTPSGATQNFWPNAFGQPTRLGTMAWSINYDLAGRLSTVSDTAGMHGYKYFEGQLDTEWHSGGPDDGMWVAHGYDSAGRLASVKLSDGSTYSYTYNSDGTLATVTTAGGATGTWSSYDSATGRAQSFHIGSLNVSSSYDLNGHATNQTSATSYTTAAYRYGYDATGHCNWVSAPDGSWSLGYDGRGYLTSGTEGCGPYSWDAAGRATGSNGYSPGARTNSSTVVLLGSVSTSSPTPTVTVSRNGVAMGGVTLNADGTFNFADRPGQGWQTYLIQATQRGTGNGGSNAVAQQTRQVYVPPTNESLRYDSGGNRAGDSRWTLSWNSFGQLTEAKDANPSGITDILFIYDYKGRMVQKLKSVNGTVVSIMRTLYDGWKPVLQIDSNGAGSELARRVYTWGPDVSGTNGGAAGIGGLIEMVEKKGGTTSNRLAIHDGKGNVTGWVDESSGARVATYSYGPFGEPVSASGSSAADCPLRWQTKLYDEDLGLYYFGKRWYDSKTRTWISPDPLRENGGVNVTCYCDNQPFDQHDPIGMSPWFGTEPWIAYRVAELEGKSPAEIHKAVNEAVQGNMQAWKFVTPVVAGTGVIFLSAGWGSPFVASAVGEGPLATVITGMASGGLGTGASQVTSNAINHQRLDKNLGGATLLGVATGGTFGLFGETAAAFAQGMESEGTLLPSLQAPIAAPAINLTQEAGGTVPEGIVYSRIDLNGNILPYGGQAQSEVRFLQRQIEHAREYPDADFEFTIVARANPGLDLDVAEHQYIQQLTGGVRAIKSPLVSNLRDPVGPARRPALGLPEPRNQ
jgi:RHS repeat-associated protein